MKKITLSILVALQCSAHAASIDRFTHGPAINGYELIFENAGVEPRTFSTTNPNTVVLDFVGVDSKLKDREIDIAKNGIYDVDLIEGTDRIRVVVNLAAPLGYQVARRGNDIVLVMDKVSQVGSIRPVQVNNRPATQSTALFQNFATEPAAAAIRPQVTANPAVASSANFVARPQRSVAPQPINSVEKALLEPVFAQKKSGSGELSFSLPVGVSNVAVRQDGNKVIALLDGFYASKSDQKRMEVDSYATPVQTVDIFRSARGTELVLNIKRNTAFEYASYQNGDIYTIEVKPVTVDDSLQKQVDELQGFSPSKHYRGAPLSLNFQDIEVRAVLQIIAEFTNNNIVVSDAVAGNITLRLDNVPWDQALDIILKTKGLGMRENGSVIYIAPASELDQRELDALKVIQERDQLVPAKTELIQIRYANAADIATILERSRESGRGDRASYVQNSILSSKGTVSVDLRTNTLLVSDIPSKLQAVRDLIARLDEPVRQVLVDARLVLTQDTFSRDFGAKFGLTFFNAGNNHLIAGSGSADAAYSLGESIHNAAVDVARGNDTTIKIPALSNRLGVNLPAGGPSYGLAILGADFLVDLELSALQTEGKVEIVSSPRVVTQDGKKARIAKGQEKRYTTLTESGPQTDFKEATLSVDVTPRIAPDDRIDMELSITKDDFASDTTKNVNNVETNVLVDNGETIVLGGVYEQTQSLNTDKVPLLGDLPLIGNAFKKTSKNFHKSELLIFVTPRIIDNKLADYDKFSNLRK